MRPAGGASMYLSRLAAGGVDGQLNRRWVDEQLEWLTASGATVARLVAQLPVGVDAAAEQAGDSAVAPLGGERGETVAGGDVEYRVLLGELQTGGVLYEGGLAGRLFFQRFVHAEGARFGEAPHVAAPVVRTAGGRTKNGYFVGVLQEGGFRFAGGGGGATLVQGEARPEGPPEVEHFCAGYTGRELNVLITVFVLFTAESRALIIANAY